ncbi:BatA domain-containing protein [Luteolibacter arcticus]|uniref:BatA domain-containing protein n=1 Tax=Luteolibacter arcticus TaxID=1581411 RepID=A0ABT3GG57_9BACT|nr:VWA domain-containing protein [Luteolibacter arcticus]MCW1922597.1 BatA domain-containing protein [Luteolibacter arcticus]
MAFLAPLFLAGLAALALPVLLHLRKNRPKETVAFSSLMFFEDQPPITKRRSRLQDILLLILRCLAIALMILAFARPFFPAKEDTPAVPGGSTTHFILIDTSASMRGEPLEKAVTAAREAIKELPEDDAIALATFSHQLHILLDPERARGLVPGERKSTALSLLGEVKAGWQATRLDSALLSAVAAAASEAPLQVHVFGDLQKGSTLDRLRGESWPDALRFILHPLAPPDAWTNAGVQMLPPEKQVRRARVSNAEGSSKADFTLEWSGSTAKTTISVPAGESAIFDAPEGVPAEGKVTLTGDDFAFDNEAAWTTATMPVVKIWHPNPSEVTDTTETTYFLHRAMQPTADYTVEIVTAPPADSPALTITDGKPGDITVLRKVIEAGGTALLTLRDAESSKVLSELFNVPDAKATEAVIKDHARFGEIDFKSPVFAPFADPRYSDFSGIRIWKYRALPEALVSPGKVLARYDSGDPAWLSYQLGEGTLHVLTTTWRPSDSQLALTTKFAPLLHSLIANAGQGRGVYFVGHDGIETPGIHAAGDRRVAIQIDPSESELTPLPEADLRALGLPLDEPVIAADKTVTATLSSAEQESRQRVGWWLLAAAALFFLAETAWAAIAGSRANPATT